MTSRLPFLLPFVIATAGCFFAPSSDSSKSEPAPPPPPDPVAIQDTTDDPAPAGAMTSSTVEVREMLPSMSVVQDETGITVYAALVHGVDLTDPGASFLDLEDGDRLTATIGSATALMRRRLDGDKIRYVARFTAAHRAMQVVISFTRDSGKPGGPYSVVTLDAPFELSSTPPADAKRGTKLPLTVTTPSRSFTVAADGPCVMSQAQQTVAVDAHGAGTFDTAPMLFGSGDPCDVTVHVQALTEGSVDSAFERGFLDAVLNVDGVQQRSFRVALVP